MELTGNTDPIPANGELEFTTIGPAIHSGESIVVHFGEGEWGVVDSCKDGDICLPLAYLRSIGVNTSQVKYIFCSHWHEDHTAGISELLRKCEDAVFVMSIAGNREEYFEYLSEKELSNGSTEFAECINILNDRKGQPGHSTVFIPATRDRRYPLSSALELYTLSPSDAIVENFLKYLANFNPEEDLEKQFMKTNMLSLALDMHLNGEEYLLGGDMEALRKGPSVAGSVLCGQDCDSCREYGWGDVVMNEGVYSNKFCFFKLPHHGSITGYCPRLWDNNVAEEIIGVTTIFRNGNVSLPKKEMLIEYNQLCKDLYITSDLGTHRARGAEKKEVDRFSERRARIVDSTYGIVRCRKSFKPNSEWKVSLFGSARLVNDEFFKEY